MEEIMSRIPLSRQTYDDKVRYSIQGGKTYKKIELIITGEGKTSETDDTNRQLIDESKMKIGDERYTLPASNILRKYSAIKTQVAPKLKSSTNTGEDIIAVIPILFTPEGIYEEKSDDFGLYVRPDEDFWIEPNWNSTNIGYISNPKLTIKTYEAKGKTGTRPFNLFTQFTEHSAGTTDIQKNNLPLNNDNFSGILFDIDTLSGNYYENVQWGYNNLEDLIQEDEIRTNFDGLINDYKLTSSAVTELKAPDDNAVVYLQSKTLFNPTGENADSHSYRVDRSNSTSVNVHLERIMIR